MPNILFKNKIEYFLPMIIALYIFIFHDSFGFYIFTLILVMIIMLSVYKNIVIYKQFEAICKKHDMIIIKSVFFQKVISLDSVKKVTLIGENQKKMLIYYEESKILKCKTLENNYNFSLNELKNYLFPDSTKIEITYEVNEPKFLISQSLNVLILYFSLFLSLIIYNTLHIYFTQTSNIYITAYFFIITLLITIILSTFGFIPRVINSKTKQIIDIIMIISFISSIVITFYTIAAI